MKTEALISALLLAAALNSLAQPIVTNQPQNQTVVLGGTARFFVGATGTGPLAYQWRSYATSFDYTNIPGATEATLVLTNVQPTIRRFGVEVSNVEGSVVSALARLIVLIPPSIIVQPTNQTVEPGSDVTFRVTASGTTPLSYQWRYNETVLVNKTNATLSLTNVQVSQAGSYSVSV